MKLIEVNCVSFRSIINKILKVNYSCYGFIGLNESGKSNLLDSIRALDKGYSYSIKDKPKMPNSPQPEIHYSFILDEQDKSKILSTINKWIKENIIFNSENIIDAIIISNEIKIIKKLDVNNKTIQEIKFNVDIKNHFNFLKSGFDNLTYIKYRHNNQDYQLNNLKILNKDFLKELKESDELIFEYDKTYNDFNIIKEKISSLKNSNSTDNNQSDIVNKEISNLEQELGKIQLKIDEMSNSLTTSPKFQEIIKLNSEIGVLNNNIKEKKSELDKTEVNKNNAQTVLSQQNNPQNLANFNSLNQIFNSTSNEYNALFEKFNECNTMITILNKSINEYYDNNPNYIINNIINYLQDEIMNILPKIIYWKYSDKYLIPSEITYTEFIKDKGPLFNCRPLFNSLILCEALNLKNEGDIKAKIEIWKHDTSEGLRDTKQLNKSINEYIKKKWPEYDQNITFNLEQNRITVHINDPNSIYNSFYAMGQRSQGCRTFISFLLTIAAESYTNLINNYILILDEPETHLHPSGVRFMRDELLKLSEQKNFVFYATHSIFMIDRKCLDRHIIIKKKDELTEIKYANERAITQEMILYKELGTDLAEFSISLNNIFFEGEADINLFEFYHEKCIKNKKDKLFKDYTFRDGDGTKTMEKFFREKIIQENSHWILILDNDKMAHKLVEYLSSDDIYKKHYNKLFKIIYYDDKDDCELEDLLPEYIIKDTVDEVNQTFGYSFMFELDKSLLIKSQLEKYKTINNIKGEESKKFTALFKEHINIRIKNILTDIETNNKTYEERLEKFKEIFPEYFKFLDNKLFKRIDKTIKSKN